MWLQLRILTTALILIGAASVSADEPYGRHQFEEHQREHWAFQKLSRPSIPAVADLRWAANPVDAFIFDELQKAGLKPAVPAEPAKILRRVYLDLIGLPPSPTELDAFLADSSPTAFARVVDDLLSRPQYGERWGRHWLDVVRYAETNGYERDGLKPHAWRYRDWVVDAFNADKPYDRFLIEQLAGDEIVGSNAETQIATTMLRLGPWDDEPADPLADRYDQLDDIVAATSATFLGLTLRCARCHDHKFEPFSQKDYTRWQAIFAPLKRPQRDRSDLDRDLGPRDEVATYQALVKQLDEKKNGFEEQGRTLAWQICSRAVADGRLTLAFDTAQVASNAPGRGAVAEQPATDSSARASKEVAPEAIKALAIEPAKRNDEQKKLVTKHAAKIKPLVEELAAEAERSQLAELAQQLASTAASYPPPLPKGYIWYEEGPTCAATHVFRRGDPRNQGDEVNSGFPAILVDQSPAPPAPTQHSTGRRLQLARWLTTADHPLTARVMVNRIWQHHFGEGIVATENDFGLMGAAPSHQALLDWLASEFVAGGWQLKHMHRLLVLSQAYQMASSSNPAAEKVEPADVLLWRYRPQRMEAEALRDTILAVSGQLNLATRGPGIYPKISRAVLETQSQPGSGWHASDVSQAARRSVYVFVKRTLLVPELEVLDFPSTEETCEQRVVSTVAPQALTFLNGEFIHEQATAFAERLIREVGADTTSRVERAYRLSFSRLPSEKERQTVLEFLAKQELQIAADSKSPLTADAVQLKALTALCLVLLNTNEFAYLQ